MSKRLGFITLKNSGNYEDAFGKLSNTCIWISIWQHMSLNDKKNSNLTIRTLRHNSGFPTSSIQFNSELPRHSTALQKCADTYDLDIIIFPVQRSGGRGSAWIKTDGLELHERYRSRDNVPPERRIAIICFNGHFELILTKTPYTPCILDKALHNPYAKKLLKVHSYVNPDEDIKTTEKKIKLSHQETVNIKASINKLNTEINEKQGIIKVCRTELLKPNLSDIERQNLINTCIDLKKEVDKLIKEHDSLNKIIK